MIPLHRNTSIRLLFQLAALPLLLLLAAVAEAGGGGEAAPVAPIAPTPHLTSGPAPTPELAGCIEGMIWYDGNNNGVKDDGEDVMDGASVLLLGVAPFRFQTGPYAVADHALTNNGGNYRLCNVRAGTYELRAKPPQSAIKDTLRLTAGMNPVQIAMADGEYSRIDFGFGFPIISNRNDSLNSP